MLPLIVVDVLLCLFACRVAVWRGYSPAVGFGAAVVSPWLGVLFAQMLPFPVDLLAILVTRVGWLLPILLPPTHEANRQKKFEAVLNRQLMQDKRLIPCGQCGRHNSVSTRICPRCEMHFGESQRAAA